MAIWLLAPRPRPDTIFMRQGITGRARDAAPNGDQRCDEFSVRLTPEARLHRHDHYFGTEVVEFAGSESSQESVEVDTHAWLEALLPVPGGGEPVWVGADPTNRGLAVENHVKIGHGATTTPTSRRSRVSTATRRTQSSMRA